MRLAAEVLLLFIALYPVCTAAFWVAGGLIFRWRDESNACEEPGGGWPGVSVLIPAFNEANVIATSVRAALAVDYPALEVLVLDDGSTDDTETAALRAAGSDSRCRVIRDPVNRGKADRLNTGLAEARHDLVAVMDADTHVHPAALKLLVARMSRSEMVAAVAGSPHVTNRGRLLLAMQVLEAAAVIGLIRRTQSVTGRVGVVAGVLGLFRRDRVLAVGGYDSRDGHRGHRPDVAAVARGLGDRLRAPRAGRHAGAVDLARPVGAAQTLGARPGRDPARPLRRGEPVAQPSHVVAELRGPGLGVLGRGAGRVADHRRGRTCVDGARAVRPRARLGDRDRGRGHDPADRCDRHRARLRPHDPAGVPPRGAVSAALLAHQRGGLTPHRGRRVDPRARRRPGGVGHPAGATRGRPGTLGGTTEER